MRRIFAHRLLVFPALCVLAGSGCATSGGTSTAEAGGEPADQSRKLATTSPAAADDNPAVIATEQTPAPLAPVPGKSSDTPIAFADADALPDDDLGNPCIEPTEPATGWLDRSQNQVYQTVCGTAAWFDGFFGDQRYDEASRHTHGRVSIAGFWDQRDGFDPKLRFRAKFALPALQARTALIVGRGNDREFIEERETPSDSIPSNFNRIEDDSFLIGLGYQPGTGLKRGLSFSVGARVRAPPEPYAKAKYNRAWELSDATLLRVRPIVYWKSKEGFGATLATDVDQLLTDKLMLRWTANGNISEDRAIEGVAWSNWLSLFQALADRKAVSYHAFVLGETAADVGIQNYGFEIRYRRRIARKWLFLEITNSLSWPKFLPEENRDINFGIGAGFEMYFGPVPDARLR